MKKAEEETERKDRLKTGINEKEKSKVVLKKNSVESTLNNKLSNQGFPSLIAEFVCNYWCLLDPTQHLQIKLRRTGCVCFHLKKCLDNVYVPRLLQV